MAETQIDDPRFIVTITGKDPETVRVGNPDMVRWEMTRAREGWPVMADAPTLWSTFVVWSALKRAGKVDEPFEVWSDTVEKLDFEAYEPVGPTKRGRGSASSLS